MQNRLPLPVVRLAARRPLIELYLPALTLLFGLQALRVVLPGLVWNLTDALGWSEAQVGTVTVLLFLTSFLALPLRR